MRAAFWVPAAAAILAAFVLACCASAKLDPPAFFSEEPAGSSKWTAVAAEPAWVTNPPARDGCLVFVAEGRSNLRSIAASGPRPSAEGDATKRVRDVLTPVVGAEDASLAASAVPAGLRLVRRACREEILSPDAVPGNTLCTAWALWEVPVDTIVAKLTPERREWARAALLASR